MLSLFGCTIVQERSQEPDNGDLELYAFTLYGWQHPLRLYAVSQDETGIWVKYIRDVVGDTRLEDFYTVTVWLTG